MRGFVASAAGCLFVISLGFAWAEQVPVRFREGVGHGFLVLRERNGKLLADGETTQESKGDRITNHVILRFHDGSLYDDTAVYSQRGSFHLLTDHLIKKGPSFKMPIDMLINVPTGEITVQYTDDDGTERSIQDHLDLPADLANGFLTTVIKNIRPNAGESTVSFVAASPKPRLVTLLISPQGRDSVKRGSITAAANHYVVKVKLGGLTGAVAPLLGKQPPDTHVWIIAGAAPAFVKLEGPLDDGGPVWRIEAAGPTGFPGN